MITYSELMAKHGVKAVFSDRGGGCSDAPFDSLNLGFGLGDSDSNVSQNLDMLCRQSEMPEPHQSVQVHGDQVIYCSGKGAAHHTEADILITSEANVALAVRTADCLPIVLADMKHGVIAAVHAGWKGTVLQVAKKAVLEMCNRGADPEHIIASLGPCIGPCCFEVNQDVAEQLEASCGQNVSSLKHGNLLADLYQANALQLKKVGLRDVFIERSPSCTACQDAPRYFSYRRDCGQTGRQLSMIMLP